MLTSEQIIRRLSQYGVSASDEQCDQVRLYIALLLKWNRTISLTTVANEAEILKFHFGESAFALSALPGLNGRLADVGAGAGFPGLPLRIFCEKIQLIMIESNGKKCAFLSEVVRELNLAAVQVVKARFDESVDVFSGGLDCVVARALGQYEALLDWSAQTLKPGGRIILWLGEDETGKLASRQGWRWSQPLAIPGSKRRYLISGVPGSTGH
jgi:16S rRNA (guanine527-N7)-methyltransferase